MRRNVHPRQRRVRELLPEKFGRCKWCGGEAKPPRRYWCSQRCIDEWKALDPRVLRDRCYERDRGFCRICGRDVGLLEMRLLKRTAGWFLRPRGLRPRKRGPWKERRRYRTTEARRDRWLRLLRRLRVEPSHLWEADHRIPVVEGGRNCLANLRTLCLPCHKGETRKLARRRALARRAQRTFAAMEAP